MTIKNHSSNFIKNNRGLSLVELLIALFLLGIVLALGYNYFFFGMNTFNRGEQQADIQQNARLAADFITRSTRIAERLVILEDGYNLEAVVSELNLEAENYYVYHIYEDNGALWYSRIKEGEIESELFESISGQIDFELDFSTGTSAPNILALQITANDQRGGGSFILDTEILILNLAMIENRSGGSGRAILYQVPAPPGPTIMGMKVSPHYYVRDEVNTGPDNLQITIYTHGLSGENVQFNVELLDLNDNSSIADQQVTFEVTSAEQAVLSFFNSSILDLQVGSYLIDVHVEVDEELNIPNSRLTWIYVVTEEIEE
jgi:prepilin-type N-terminal cleavage/methylation domain-containing protein